MIGDYKNHCSLVQKYLRVLYVLGEYKNRTAQCNQGIVLTQEGVPSEIIMVSWAHNLFNSGLVPIDCKSSLDLDLGFFIE